MKSFNVYGILYRHIKTDKLPEGAIGYCCPDTKTIATHPSLKGKALMATILHELDHAKNFEIGLHQTMELSALEVSADAMARIILDNFNVSPRRKKKKRKR